MPSKLMPLTMATNRSTFGLVGVAGGGGASGRSGESTSGGPVSGLSRVDPEIWAALSRTASRTSPMSRNAKSPSYGGAPFWRRWRGVPAAVAGGACGRHQHRWCPPPPHRTPASATPLHPPPSTTRPRARSPTAAAPCSSSSSTARARPRAVGAHRGRRARPLRPPPRLSPPTRSTPRRSTARAQWALDGRSHLGASPPPPPRAPPARPARPTTAPAEATRAPGSPAAALSPRLHPQALPGRPSPMPPQLLRLRRAPRHPRLRGRRLMLVVNASPERLRIEGVRRRCLQLLRLRRARRGIHRLKGRRLMLGGERLSSPPSASRASAAGACSCCDCGALAAVHQLRGRP